MSITHVLGLSGSELATRPLHYTSRLEDDRIENYNRDQIDSLVGHLTASFNEVMHVSGTIAEHLGQGQDVGGEYYGGLRYNAQSNRIITKITAFQRMSGSGGTTTVDIQKIAAGALPGTNESIFSDLVFKCNLSASDGDGAVAETSTFAPGSSSWAAGELLGVVLDEVTGGESADLTVQVHWKPSASFAVPS